MMHAYAFLQSVYDQDSKTQSSRRNEAPTKKSLDLATHLCTFQEKATPGPASLAYDALCKQHERRGAAAYFLRPSDGQPASAGGGPWSISGCCTHSRLQGELRRLPQLRRRGLRMRPQRRWAFAGSLHHYRLQRFRHSQCPHEQRRVRLPVCRRRRLHRVRVPDPSGGHCYSASQAGSLRELEEGRRRRRCCLRRVPTKARQG